MLTEVVMIEDRVLRFEKAKNSLKINGADNRTPGYNQGYESSVAGTEDHVSHNATGTFFVHPHVYVPYYAFHHQTQQYHTFHVPHQTIPIYNSMEMYQPKFVSVSDEVSSNEILNKMFVGHLNGESVTQRKLLRYFQQYGHITDIELFKNNFDGSLRLEAFAFISYLKAEQVQQAIKEGDGKEWLGRRLKCCLALKKRGSGNSSPVLDSVEYSDEAAENLSVPVAESEIVPVAESENSSVAEGVSVSIAEIAQICLSQPHR